MAGAKDAVQLAWEFGVDVILSSAGIDAQECEVLVSGYFQDERPLKGSCGWIDWRLNGRLSRFLTKERLTGEWKETTLIPSQGRTMAPLILLLGLGRLKEYSYLRLRQLFPYLFETLEKLKTTDIGLALPEDEGHNVECGKLTEILIEGVADWLGSGSFLEKEGGTRNLRLFFTEKRERFPEILLGVQTARSILEERFEIRIFTPTEKDDAPAA